MTLGKGNHLIKVTPYEPSSNDGTFADRVRLWATTHPDGEITEQDLAQILCPNESYVIHEVMTDVHYRGHEDHFSYAPSVDLKVIY